MGIIKNNTFKPRKSTDQRKVSRVPSHGRTLRLRVQYLLDIFLGGRRTRKRGRGRRKRRKNRNEISS